MNLILILSAGLALGIVMGLLGGGGGILAVPLLLALGLPYASATTTSLVVVGVGALAGLGAHARAKRVDWRLGTAFGLLGSVGAVLGSRASALVEVRWQMAGFIVLLLAAAWGMLRPRGRDETESAQIGVQPRWGRVFLVASGVGFVTGFFGVGGGFIAVPALVLALKMPMKRASATALLVIAINTAVAFAAHGVSHLDQQLTLAIGLATVVGGVFGAALQPRINAASLRTAFGVLLLMVAAYEMLHLFS